DVAALLRFVRVNVVDVQRVVVHRDQAEEVIVGLGDGLRRPVLVDVADLELLEVAVIRVCAARLARGLLGLDGLRLAHGVLGVSSDRLLAAQTLLTKGEAVAFTVQRNRDSRPGETTCATPETSSSHLRSTRPSRCARSR